MVMLFRMGNSMKSPCSFLSSGTNEIFFLMGADNLITFHKWHQWKLISSKCNILVFDRTNYKSKSLNSVAFRKLRNEGLKFIKFKKVNISSSKLRKI